MPNYEFECPKCKKVIELQVKIKDAVTLAPLCCEDDCGCRMNRIISKSSFSLKGSNWARDGYSGKR